MRLLLIFILSFSVSADPVELEVVFLSHKQISALLHNIDQGFTQSKNLYVQADIKNCIPMGEGCFHPQYGMIPVEEFEAKKKQKQDKEDEAGNVEVNTINATETNLINCDKKNYFDIYCGKSKSTRKIPVFEVWVDTSSSLRNADYSKDMLYCERRHFVSGLRKQCGDKILFSTFDSTVSSLGSDQNLCNNAGMNNSPMLVDAIKGSNAKYLLIVTDVDEYKDEFREYLDLVGAKLTGIGATKVTAEQLSGIYSKKFKKICK